MVQSNPGESVWVMVSSLSSSLDTESDELLSASWISMACFLWCLPMLLLQSMIYKLFDILLEPDLIKLLLSGSPTWWRFREFCSILWNYNLLCYAVKGFAIGSSSGASSRFSTSYIGLSPCLNGKTCKFNDSFLVTVTLGSWTTFNLRSDLFLLWDENTASSYRSELLPIILIGSGFKPYLLMNFFMNFDIKASPSRMV
mgnify:CR=1 FL=1